MARPTSRRPDAEASWEIHIHIPMPNRPYPNPLVPTVVGSACQKCRQVRLAHYLHICHPGFFPQAKPWPVRPLPTILVPAYSFIARDASQS